MTTTAHPDRAAAPTLPAALRLGPVHLTVTDLDRSVAWYQEALGLRVHRHDPDAAELGDGEVATLVLVEEPQARRPGRTAGLYHYALLFPSREELARAAIRLSLARTPIQGASDHGTHEAIYLPDPDGNGIELAADRPREVWPTPEEEFGGGGPRPLDFDALLATIAGEVPAPQVGPGLRMGHLHLHVGDVEQGLAFYRDLIGFEVWGMLPSAAFVSAGGYHHHLGFNVWRGEGVPPAPAGIVGLREWTVELPAAEDVAAVRARLEAAGVPVEPSPRGFLVRDPWALALRIVEAGA
ncbi:MAG: VOC family protein [Solirubrobacteraceae bacterium]